MNYIRLFWKLFQLKKNEKISIEDMKQLQKKKLQGILEHSFENSKYYRESFRRAGITSKEQLRGVSLEQLPVITKQELLTNFDDLITVKDISQEQMREFDEQASLEEKTLRGYHVVHSSGSTGKPGYFLYDEKAWENMLIGIIRGALWDMNLMKIWNLLRKRPKVLFIAATDGRYGGAMAVGEGLDGVGAKQLQLDINMPTEIWIKKVREFNPNIIIGYPSAIKILGELVESGKIQADISMLVSCGEPLSPGLRHFFEKVFCKDIINFYGASESLALGIENSHSDGMILFDDLNIIEALNGKLYLTCLYNYAQPLIRYEITDHLVMKTEYEGPFSKAEILLSRSEDLLWFDLADGSKEFLHPLSVEGICVEGLIDYQFQKTKADSFVMYVQIDEKFDAYGVCEKIIDVLRPILEEKGLGSLEYHLQPVHEILPDSKTGKKRLILPEKNG